MTKAVYVGSFAPVTRGHQDIIFRASAVFDKLIVAVTQNTNKPQYIAIDDRVSLLNQAAKELPNIEVVSFDGFIGDFCIKHQINCIVKSVRNVIDLEYETEMSVLNKQLFNIDTLFFVASPEYKHISSSMVRELIRLNGDISQLVPQGTAEKILQVTKCF